MDITTLTDIMKTLEKKFNAEIAKINVTVPDRNCDTEFLKLFLSTYDFWRIYLNMPENNPYKPFYLNEVEKRIKKLL